MVPRWLLRFAQAPLLATCIGSEKPMNWVMPLYETRLAVAEEKPENVIADDVQKLPEVPLVSGTLVFFMQLEIQGKNISVLPDTGSVALWVPASDCSGCEENWPRLSMNETQNETLQATYGRQRISYMDGTSVSGFYAVDEISLSGSTGIAPFKSALLLVDNYSSPLGNGSAFADERVAGVLGLSPGRIAPLYDQEDKLTDKLPSEPVHVLSGFLDRLFGQLDHLSREFSIFITRRPEDSPWQSQAYPRIIFGAASSIEGKVSKDIFASGDPGGVRYARDVSKAFGWSSWFGSLRSVGLVDVDPDLTTVGTWLYSKDFSTTSKGLDFAPVLFDSGSEAIVVQQDIYEGIKKGLQTHLGLRCFDFGGDPENKKFARIVCDACDLSVIAYKFPMLSATFVEHPPSWQFLPGYSEFSACITWQEYMLQLPGQRCLAQISNCGPNCDIRTLGSSSTESMTFGLPFFFGHVVTFNNENSARKVGISRGAGGGLGGAPDFKCPSPNSHRALIVDMLLWGLGISLLLAFLVRKQGSLLLSSARDYLQQARSQTQMGREQRHQDLREQRDRFLAGQAAPAEPPQNVELRPLNTTNSSLAEPLAV